MIVSFGFGDWVVPQACCCHNGAEKKVVKPDEVPEGEQMFTHSGIPSSINALHLTGMEDDLKTILEHAMFEDIVNVNPIPFTLSSSANPHNAQQFGT